MEKTLSIIIPCYNEVNTIEKVIDVINSVDLKKQIILVDDYSNDGTKDLLEKKLKDKIDILIFNKENKGKGAAIKEGLSMLKAML